MRKTISLICAIGILLGMLPEAFASGTYRGELNNDYVFSIYGENESFTVLESDENGYFVIANDYYDVYSYDTVTENSFSFTNEGSIGYWLNNGFLESDNTLDYRIIEYIDFSHEWDEGVGGISLLSEEELNRHSDKIGFYGNFNKTEITDNTLTQYKYWWLKDSADNKASVCTGVSSLEASVKTLRKTTPALVRPVFYLKSDFFKKIKVNTFYLGKNIKPIVKAAQNQFYNSTENEIIADTENNNIVNFDLTVFPDNNYLSDGAYFEIKLTEDSPFKEGYKIKMTCDGKDDIIKNVNFKNAQEVVVKIYLPEANGQKAYNISIYNGETFIKSIIKEVIQIQDVENDGYKKLGYNTHIPQTVYDLEKTVELLDNLGVKLVRDHGLWSSVETTKNEYVWSDKFINYVKKLHEKGIGMVYILTTNNPLYGDSWNGKLDTVDEINGFSNYAVATAKQFPEIKYFEILNEANSIYTKEEYAKVAAATAKALKEYNPEIQVIAGAVADSLPTQVTPWKEFASGFVDENTYAYIDAISYHSYNERYYADSKAYQNSFAVLKSALNSFGGFKDLYVTETGFGTGIFWYPETASERVQANETVKRSVVNENNGISLVTNYVLYDEDASEEWGIVKNDGTPKEAYFAMKNFYERTKDAVFMGEIEAAEDIRAFWYRNNGENFVIMWQKPDSENQRYSVENANPSVLTLQSGVKVTDIYGKEIENSGTINVSTDVIYIEGLSEEYLKNAYSDAAEKRVSYAKEYVNNSEVDVLIEDYKELYKNPTEQEVTSLITSLYNLGLMFISDNTDSKVNLSAKLSELNNICDEVAKLMILCDSEVKESEIDITRSIYESFERTFSETDMMKLIYGNEPFKRGRKLLDEVLEFKGRTVFKASQTEHSRLDINGEISIFGNTQPHKNVSVMIENGYSIGFLEYVISDENGYYSIKTSLSEQGEYTMTVNDGNIYTEAISYVRDDFASDEEKLTSVKNLQAKQLLSWAEELLNEELSESVYLYLENVDFNINEDKVKFDFIYNNDGTYEQNPKLIVSSFIAGKLAECKILDVKSGENICNTELMCGENTEIKVMLVDSMSTIKPLKRTFVLDF